MMPDVRPSPFTEVTNVAGFLRCVPSRQGKQACGACGRDLFSADMSTRRASSLVLVAVLLSGVVTAEQAAPVQLRVARQSTSRSNPVTVGVGQDLVVRLVETERVGAPFIRVFVHDSEGTLAAMDDPEKSADAFSFALPAGKYVVTIRNSGSAGAVLSLSTTPARALVRTAPLATVRLFYATDRIRVTDRRDVAFGAEPAATMSYGHADVTIPRGHRMGEVEGPSIWRLEFSSNPDLHVVLQPPVPAAQAAFFRVVSDRLAQSSRRQVFVFVHGFNVPFDDAARRAAQIAYDIGFDGPPILFSWPSQGGPWPLDYTKDQRNADLSAESLKTFLRTLAASSPGATIHLLAHSMGARVVAGALQQLAAERPASSPKVLRQLALLAPDVDAELFRRAAGRLASLAERVTLYASSKDDGLALSQRLAGYKRAGQAGPDLVVVPGVDTIDASNVETSAFGLKHLYYGDSSTVLSDVFDLFRDRPPSERARLEPVNTASQRFWRFRPAAR